MANTRSSLRKKLFRTARLIPVIGTFLIVFSFDVVHAADDAWSVRCLRYLGLINGVSKSTSPAVEKLRRGQTVYKNEARTAVPDAQTLNDLEIEKSVIPSLQTAHTVMGNQRIDWLMHHPFLDANVIRARQDAAKELQAKPALRRKITTILDEITPALELAHENLIGDQQSRTVREISKPASGVLFNFGVLPAIGYVAGNWAAAGVPAFIGFMKWHINFAANRLEERIHLRAYKTLFKKMKELESVLREAESPNLKEIANVVSILSNPDEPVSTIATRFRRMAHPAWTVVPDMLWYHSGWTLRGPRHAISDYENELASVFSAIGELDSYVSFADLADKPGYSFPTILDGVASQLTINSGHHPVLYVNENKKSVSNSVSIKADEPDKPGQNFVVVTGPNMAGKSTFMRMVAVLPMQAQTGSPVPARGMQLTPLQVKTSMKVSDSLEAGKSLFDQETDQLKRILDAREDSRPILFILDEILLGTNPKEREAAEREIIRYLSDSQHLFALATHNLQVTTLADENGHVQNWHFTMQMQDGQPSYSFQVQPGPATESNALLILEHKGFPHDVVERARQSLQTPLTSHP